MAINQTRPDTPLAATPEPRFVQDSTKTRTWQQMSVAEKGAKKTELIKKGGLERFKQYKDSVSADASDRANKMFEKNAATRGMTVEELRKSNARDARKGPVPQEGLEIGKACKRGATKGSCSTGVSNRGESLRDTR